MSKRSDPVENVRTYIMATGGLQQQARMVDMEWVTGVVEAAKAVDYASSSHASTALETALEHLSEVLRRG